MNAFPDPSLPGVRERAMLLPASAPEPARVLIAHPDRGFADRCAWLLQWWRPTDQALVPEEWLRQVSAVTDPEAVLRQLQEDCPDVVVCSALLAAKAPGAFSEALREAYYQHGCRAVWLTPFLADGRPFRDWEGMPEDNFLVEPADPWQVVMAVSQLRARAVARAKGSSAEVTRSDSGSGDCTQGTERIEG